MLHQLRSAYQRQLERSRVPDGVSHRFDDGTAGSLVEKTKQREVITLELERFQAVEVVRTVCHEKPQRLDSPLRNLVPKGGTYGYDLIAHVGCETFLRGRKLEDVWKELPRQIPFSSLFDLQHKFLFYFGHMHRQAAPRLANHFRQQGGSTWLIDGTIEPGTPMFFGVYDAQSRWLLDAWKIASENADAIAPCLEECTQRFGRPQRVLHDLSDAMETACERTWDQMPHGVCHFHLLRDIGEDLYAPPQAALSQRVRQLKLQARLKEKRKGQTQWLRQHVEQPTVLAEALRGAVAGISQQTLGREVLLAFHQWVLDYASDGQRQGFPFDPYLLYFHRRVVRASVSVGQLLSNPLVRQRVPQVLINFENLLREYVSDSKVIAAAWEYEEASALFAKLRMALRLQAGGEQPLRDRYLLEDGETNQVRQSLATLREESRVQAEAAAEEFSRRCHAIVVQHLDRYWDCLFAQSGGANRDRTTNGLESHWGRSKRQCRKRHGRDKLTRDFQSLPPEFMLVINLENPSYVELVLGDLACLPEKLALAGRTAGPWTHWRALQLQDPLNTGRLPRRVLRKEHFVENLITFYDDQCQREVA